MKLAASSQRFIPSSLIGAAAAVFTIAWLLVVQHLGISIPQPRIERDYVVAVFWALLLAAAIRFAPLPARDRVALLYLWAARCVVTLGFMLLYEAQLGADGLDAFTYYALSVSPVKPALLGDLLSGGSGVMANLAWYHNLLVPDSYHALKVSCSLLGLLGVYGFFRAARIVKPDVSTKWLYLLGLFPSILFWSSILGKDPIVFFGLGLYAWGVAGVLCSRSHTGPWLRIAGGVLVAGAIRIWLAPIMLAPLIVVGILALKGLRRVVVVALTIPAALLAWRLLASQLQVGSLQNLLALLQALSTSGGWAGGSATGVTLHADSLAGALAYLPRGMFNALFRPFPGEVNNPFGVVAGLESVVLLVLALMALRRVRFRHWRDPVFQFSLGFVLAWAVVYAFLSSQNFGAAVRFRLQVLPFLLSACYYIRIQRLNTAR